MGQPKITSGLSDARGRPAARGGFARAALRAFFASRSGATAVEYGLIVACIFLVIVASINFFTQNANSMFNAISNAVASATT